MTNHDYKQSAYYLLYLMRCALNGKTPKKEKLDKMDLSGVFALAKAHTLTAIAAYALSSGGVIDPRFMEEKYKAIRKNITFDAERRNVLAELEKEAIWYCQLKGCIIKDWYPEIGMRQMSVNDILCDENRMTDVRTCMERLDFETDLYGKCHQDVYKKEPVCNFEMHSCLVEPHHGDAIYEYYRNIKEKLMKDDDNSFGYHFSDEDFYVYCIAHEYKHFAGTGTGLRSLADTYVMLQKFGDDLDWSYINNELNKLGISDFERNNRELTLALFSGKELSAEQKKLLDYHIFSGTYGVIEHRIQNNIGENASVLAKLKYAASRAKVPEGDMREFHPFFYKHKALRPILYAEKVIKKLLFNSRPMIREIKALLK